ncbi:hypothetical protein J2X45_001380 [Caulobacter sp. BE264]|uniref:hypothetical protein n=1 Tax=Caulobacter sp. BE264 TaxID=2817724 RepID=UPI002857110B|nr:hypothetical protein [Caulobacter sp. BE264]MDR7230299.1 hypothetical protein [Caulobacter sp. BE264]
MTQNALETFVARVRTSWGPLTTEVVADCHAHLEALLQAAPTEPWLASLIEDRPARRELYRDPDHGFVLLAHAEDAGLYRSPHDHGRSWVLYGVQSGDMEMCTYAPIEAEDHGVRLVRRDAAQVFAGKAMAYLPGDVHDTRCVAGPALLFRFTERDLTKEDKEEGRVTRFVERDGVWTIRAS